ncbi:TetR/AcrR family transcriptional regulator [Flavobacterium capsici]|uniref:TetR/AcrR family transcriptional regulator n=1 Tax=Flavobacterium capsici TaxID=3075618 RepID=A0AA96J3B8_9FLAO|nr:MULTISPECIES: TetR/AcrR family transcriptional regulator [unclassified Flavobacterium]WNM19098.1 TetR/AcrR family transcriptional regulator [Flavobacterium sp. PMR2A8]WNM20487.1 TetR/AcrR family transcriptional regulator [Flavobacterium sp. PMTSA4]
MKVNDRKTEIINCAAKLFKEKGYSAVTMRDIAQAMNIKAASLYNHIKSKQEILVLIVIDIAEEFTAVMNDIVSSETSTIQKIEKVIQLHIDITLRNPEALACLNNDWMHLTDEELVYFIKMREEYEQNFREIILKGIENNEIKNLNSEVIIFSMLSTLRTLYLWYGKKKGLTETSLRNHMSEALLRGIV